MAELVELVLEESERIFYMQEQNWIESSFSYTHQQGINSPPSMPDFRPPKNLLNPFTTVKRCVAWSIICTEYLESTLRRCSPDLICQRKASAEVAFCHH